MFIIALILFVGGIFLIGFSFSVPAIPALIFIVGILCVAAALAIPVHFSGANSHR
jgi:hypothetical protein